MSEPPGVQPALGIEMVEWFASGGEQLTVRVTGRWLRRPAGSRGQAMLVVAADGKRHRFPAMPEPPSVGGTPPGAWRVSFSVPAWLAPYLSRRLSLQTGGVIIPLPGARAVNAQDVEAEQLTPEIDDEFQLAAAAEPRPEEDQLARTEARVHELEQELAELRAAEQAVSAEPSDASARRADALRAELKFARAAPAAPSSGPSAEQPEPHGLRLEQAMLAARPQQPRAIQRSTAQSSEQPAETTGQSEQLRRALDEVRVELEGRTESEARLNNTVESLRRELQGRTAAEAHVRAQLAMLQGTLEARGASQALLESTLDELRQELAEIRTTDDRGSAELAESESRQAALKTELAQLQSELAELRSQLATLGGARDQAENEVLALRTEISTLRGELSAAHEVSRRDAAALAEAETLLAEATQLATDAEARLASEHERAQQAVAAREQVEREFAEYRTRSVRVHGAIEELRRQLSMLRGAHGGVDETAASGTAVTAAPGHEGAAAAVTGSEDATSEAPYVQEAPSEASDAPGEVSPERLAEALTRLRETSEPAAAEPPEPAAAAEPPEPAAAAEPPEPAAEAEPPEPAAEAEPAAAQPVSAPGPAAQPESAQGRRAWLRPVLKSLAAEDSEAAGRVVIDLLPAQAAVAPRPVAYDLVLGEREVIRVTVAEDVQIERTAHARERDEVDAKLTGDLASLARYVTSGPLRRRFGRHKPSVEGDRRALAGLRTLGRSDLGLRQLLALGVRFDPVLTLELVARMIKPAWTSGERFTIAHEQGAGRAGASYLHVRDGDALSVTTAAPLGPVASTLVCSAESLMALLAGERRAEVALRGDERPLALLQQWTERAQSG